MVLTPEIVGKTAIRSSSAGFLSAFQQRVANGLLSGTPHPRSNYRVIAAGSDFVRVRAVDWQTAFNVGLNDLELRVQPGAIEYRVRFWRWAAYAITLGAALGLIGLFCLLVFDARDYIARHPSSMLPGLSVDQNLFIAWAMVVFWGFVWPWLLIALHKRPLHRLVVRLIGEVDTLGGTC